MWWFGGRCHIERVRWRKGLVTAFIDPACPRPAWKSRHTFESLQHHRRSASLLDRGEAVPPQTPSKCCVRSVFKSWSFSILIGEQLSSIEEQRRSWLENNDWYTPCKAPWIARQYASKRVESIRLKAKTPAAVQIKFSAKVMDGALLSLTPASNAEYVVSDVSTVFCSAIGPYGFLLDALIADEVSLMPGKEQPPPLKHRFLVSPPTSVPY